MHNNILLDLTPLLDVIFIILLIFVSQTIQLKKTSAGEAQRLQDEYKEAKKEYDLRNEMIDDYYTFVTVISTYDEENPENREIRISRDPNEADQIITLNGSDVEQEYSEFEECLKGYIDPGREAPIVFSLNQGDERILYRDENRIREIVEKLQNSNNNVYFKKE
ncbi:MAG: hypothetical protein K6E34_08985 [Lachnospiraceae bacterium]|nr:hypothetical protein [Lachnospiraceae bacterium]